MRKVFIAVLLLLLTGTLAAQQTLNNGSILELIKAGFSEDMIVSTINASPGEYDISVDGVLALTAAGAGEKVLAAIVAKAGGSRSEAKPAPVTPAPAPTPPPAQVSIPDAVKSNRTQYHRVEIFAGSTYYYPNYSWDYLNGSRILLDYDNYDSSFGLAVAGNFNLNSVLGIKMESS